jgi:DNA (cytosine-5)-methyltransferase 1
MNLPRSDQSSLITAVDLFCGAGGLTHGLRKAGIRVVAGIDIDPDAEFAFRTNNPGSEYLCWDLERKKIQSIANLFEPGKLRLLAGCAPCQPFSKYTNGKEKHRAWNLLNHFGRLVDRIRPELVTMENVPELAGRGRDVFDSFLKKLERAGYQVDWSVVDARHYGVPQSRQRLVLLGSRLGEISIPEGTFNSPNRWRTVRQTIGKLKPLESGGEDPLDPLHVASRLSEMNLRRVRATRHDGGSRKDWPDELLLPCQKRESGKTYVSVYGRMWWDQPAPTITTLCTGIGNGRFGHPEQDRAISLREAALIQSFPKTYRFWPSDNVVNRSAVSRMIGNAVPPKLAEALGNAIVAHVGVHS